MNPEELMQTGDIAGFYITNAEPADPVDPANYELVGLLTGHDGTDSKEMLDATTFETFGHANSIDGEASYTRQVNFNFDKSLDAGQEMLKTAARTRGEQVWWMISTLVEGEEMEYGRAGVSQYQRSSPKGQMRTGSATLTGRGAVQSDVVPAAP